MTPITVPTAIHAPVDHATILRCIAMRETGSKKHPEGDDASRGKKGETTRWQILPASWNRFADKPWNRLSPNQRRQVAEGILREIVSVYRARHNGSLPDAWEIAVRWRLGANCQAITFEAVEYADEVLNLYLDARKSIKAP